MRFVFFCIFIINLLINESKGANTPCIYDINPQGVIDLSSVGNQGGTPRWKNVDPTQSDGHVYSYNPCYPFTESHCVNVAACQVFATDETLIYSLGTQNSIQWHSSGGTNPPYITYSSGERTSQIDLVCLQSGDDHLEVLGHDSASGLYKMILSTKCACWDGCKGGRPSTTAGPGPHTDSKSLSIGAIFIIILVAVLFVYLVTFTLINKYKYEATGLDLIPHRSFWLSIPINVLYGIRFSFGKLTGKSSTYQSV